MTEPLILAVVGHTNTGKTSLLRTLTRDRGFGEVSHRPSTTRHVEGARLSVDGEALLELYDTPGLEDAIALLDYLDALERPASVSMARNAWRGCWTATKRAGVSNRKPRWSASCSPPTPGST